MWQVNNLNANDVKQSLNLLQEHVNNVQSPLYSLFNAKKSLQIARAPGRLDLMGGIADYSGSEVLQMPLSEAAVVMVQATDEAIINIVSASLDGGIDRPLFSAPMKDILSGATGSSINLRSVRQYFEQHPHGAWAAYIAGVIPVILQFTRVDITCGFSIFLHSRVPEGKGVSSSAAIEVATMSAITGILGLDIDSRQLAILCQKVENEVVGAPCGLMDQMTSSAGKKNGLLSLLCQPDVLQPDVELPAELDVWGIDSGIRHSVSGADYGSVRTGAFMGYRILLDLAGIASGDTPAEHINDIRWNGYLANVTPFEFVSEFEHRIPDKMSGHAFLKRYGALTDTVSSLDPEREYPVKMPTSHPIHEHERVKTFKHQAAINSEQAYLLMGECLYQSHESYSLCGLGSTGTDDLVSRFKDYGLQYGIYGARITGGGSGGTVAVLAKKNAGKIIHKIAEEYRRDSGIGGYVFHGSSDGAKTWKALYVH